MFGFERRLGKVESSAASNDPPHGVACVCTACSRVDLVLRHRALTVECVKLPDRAVINFFVLPGEADDTPLSKPLASSIVDSE